MVGLESVGSSNHRRSVRSAGAQEAGKRQRRENAHVMGNCKRGRGRRGLLGVGDKNGLHRA